MRVHVRLLGGFEVDVGGRSIPASAWRRRSATDVVKLLALQPNHRMMREQATDALWPDLPQEAASSRLHKAAHYARAALGTPDALVLSGGVLSLFPSEEVIVDVAEFEQASAIARSEGSTQAAREAAGKYAGDLLPDDLYEPWTEEHRSRLRLLWLELLHSVGSLEDVVRADPLDEKAHLALIRDHVGAGRRQPALAALDRMAEIMARELGVGPGPEALELRRKAEALPVQAPLRTPLPAERTRLIGRDADVATVAGLLREHRLVTLTGPGGVGKSTLALAVARRIQSDSEAPADAVLAELAPVRDAEGVTRAVAEAAGVQGEGAVRATALAANLGPRRMLVVLDNCEHLLDACADLVDAILDAGAGAVVLATSREPLRVGGEAEHRLGSLGAESVDLFVERARAAVGPGLVASDDPRVVELCERLDGLPLAIELAAAQLRHLELQQLLERLDDRLALLVGGRPKAGPRHVALTATIEWSHRLLSADSRDVFDRLAVFPASFDLEAAQAIATEHEPGHVTNLMGDLVAKSLVVHDALDARYRMLETIRLFGERRLGESGLRTTVTERLRQHVVGRATAQPRVQAWLSTSLAARSRRDLDTVRLGFEVSLTRGDLTAAVDLAVGLSTLWRNAVSYAEGRRWVSALAQTDLEPRDRLWTLILDADVALGSGDVGVMRRAAGEAVILSADVDDEGAGVIAAIYDAMARLAPPERAAQRLDDAAAGARAAGEPGLERLARGFRVAALRLAGRAEGLREEGLLLTDDAPDRDYARYLCHWATSLVALIDRDGPWLQHIMRQQRLDLSISGLHENWLTLYWGALALVADGGDFLPQLRLARARAEAEGRTADADCVLVLAYAAACRDEWSPAAELLGATHGALLHDTASFIHQDLLHRQLVEPRLDPEHFAQLIARGRARTLSDILEEHGL